MTRLLRRLVLLLPVALLAVGCGSTRTSVQSDSPWLEPSPALRQQIEDAGRRLPWTHGMERIELIHWFARIGEPAYPTLLSMVSDPRKDVASSALAALGSTRDSRLVEPLRQIPWPESADDQDLRLERARTLLRLGDWQMVPVLVSGLRDERMVIRALCIQALEEATRERLGFDPRATPEKRAAAVERWDRWASERLGDPLLARPAPAAQASDRGSD